MMIVQDSPRATAWMHGMISVFIALLAGDTDHLSNGPRV